MPVHALPLAALSTALPTPQTPGHHPVHAIPSSPSPQRCLSLNTALRRVTLLLILNTCLPPASTATLYHMPHPVPCPALPLSPPCQRPCPFGLSRPAHTRLGLRTHLQIGSRWHR